MIPGIKRKRDDSQLASPVLIEIVKEIQSFNGTTKERTAFFEKKYPDFVSKYNYLFKMACESDFDFERFAYMLNLRDQITAQQVTLEDASKEVGQKMFDVYIKDNLPPPPTEANRQ